MTEGERLVLLSATHPSAVLPLLFAFPYFAKTWFSLFVSHSPPLRDMCLQYETYRVHVL